MSQPVGPHASKYPPESEGAEEASLWSSTEGVTESLLSEPTDLRSRLAEAGEPQLSSGTGLLTYEPYYGLSEKPFSLSTDPKFLYKSRSHAPVFHELLAAIRRREGLVVLTGDIGAGKTTLCRAVLGHLDRKTFTAFVPDPFLSREDLLKTLLLEFGVVSVEDVRRGRLQGASRVELSYPLYEFLRSLAPLEAFAVLVIDEAQNLSLSLLEEIRILSDLEDGRKLLQVVLVGQPEFREHLKASRMRQVDQRVSMRCELRPLTREGLTNYVAHRLSTAGAQGDRVTFAPAGLDLVFEASGGIPRVINLICDRALERGHRGGAASIGPNLVAGAIADLQLGQLTQVASDKPHVRGETSQSSGFAIAAQPVPSRPVAVVKEPVAEAREAPAPAPARGLFGKQAPANVTIARGSELDMLLDLAPTTTKNESGLLARSTSTSTQESVPAEPAPRAEKSRLEDLRSGRARRFGLLPTMALAIIGTLTGAGLVAYLLWMAPLLRETTNLPPVSPVSRQAAPPMQTAAAATTVPAASAPQPNPVTGGQWAVQVAAFSSATRTRALIDQLAAEGFPAYEGPTNVGRLGLRLVLVGPYPSSEAAESALDRIRQIPGLDGALLRNLETGENF